MAKLESFAIPFAMARLRWFDGLGEDLLVEVADGGKELVFGGEDILREDGGRKGIEWA